MLRKKGKLKQKRKPVGSGFMKKTSLTLGSDKTDKFYILAKGVFVSSVYEPLRLLFNYPNTLVNADKKISGKFSLHETLFNS